MHAHTCLALLVLLLTVPPSLADTVPADKATEDGGLLWYDVRLLDIEGQGWKDVKLPFDRLPAKAEKLVRKEVWGLSQHAAGIAVRFQTDAREISARWTLTSKNLALPHMPATGVSGL